MYCIGLFLLKNISLRNKMNHTIRVMLLLLLFPPSFERRVNRSVPLLRPMELLLNKLLRNHETKMVYYS